MASVPVVSGDRLTQRPTSLREQIRELTKALISSGDLTPGSLVSVAQIADRFRVSRTPVREALLELANAGLLRAELNRGFRIVEHSSEELDQLSEVRLMLEVPAMVKVAQLRPPPTRALSHAAKLVQAMGNAADKGDVVQLLVLDREFHMLLVEQCGNPLLTRLLDEIRDRLHLPGLQVLARTGRLRERAADEHGELLDAISEGDGRRAGKVAEAHVKRTRSEWAAQVARPEAEASSSGRIGATASR